MCTQQRCTIVHEWFTFGYNSLMNFLWQQWRKLSSCFPRGGQNVHVESFTPFWSRYCTSMNESAVWDFLFLRRYLSSWEAWHSSLGEWSVAEPRSAGSSQAGGGFWVILPLGLLTQLYWPTLIPIHNRGSGWTGSVTVQEIKKGLLNWFQIHPTHFSAPGNALRNQSFDVRLNDQISFHMCVNFLHWVMGWSIFSTRGRRGHWIILAFYSTVHVDKQR